MVAHNSDGAFCQMSQNTIPLRPSHQPQQSGSAKLLIIALILGVITVMANLAYLQIVKSQAHQRVFKVYQLTRPIKAGRTIQMDDLESLELPESVRPGFDGMGAIFADALPNRIGREVLQETVSQGQLLTYSLFQHSKDRRVDEQIAMDKRWISLTINSRTVPGALRVGMFVDIEAPFNTGGAYPEIMPVMERMQIQALGVTTIADTQVSDRPSRNFQTITIEVTPSEATQLATIQRVMAGDFELQPRNPKDEKRVKIPMGGINPAVLSLMAKITRENPNGASRQ